MSHKLTINDFDSPSHYRMYNIALYYLLKDGIERLDAPFLSCLMSEDKVNEYVTESIKILKEEFKEFNVA